MTPVLCCLFCLYKSCSSLQWRCSTECRSALTIVLFARPKEFPKNTYQDDEDDSRGLPPTDSEDEE